MKRLLLPPGERERLAKQLLASVQALAASNSDSEVELNAALDFVDSLQGELAPEVLAQTRALLSEVHGALHALRIPTIAVSPAGLAGLTWESPQRHVNVQVHPDRRIEYFAEDLTTGELWSYETPWSSPPGELIEQLRREC